MKTKSSKIPVIPPRDRRLILVASCLLALKLAPTAQAQVIQIPYWYNIGPKPINEWVIVNQDEFHQSQTLVEQDSGRVAALAVDPSDQTHWLIGSAHGGIWETPNSGVDWYPRSDNQASLAMGAIAFAPSNPSLVYAGTGEQNFRGDAYAGAGLLVSHDGGGHWGMLNTNFAKTSFSHIWVNPANSSNLVVSTVRGGGGIGEESSGFGNVPGAPPRGVFVSTNSGATFDRVLTGEATALEVDGNNFNGQYAALGEIYGDPTNGVYRTGNGWKTSQLIQGPWMVDSNSPLTIGRIAIAESTTLFSTLYVGVSFSRSRYLAPLNGIWMTTDAWNATPTWTQLPNPGVFVDNVGSPKFWYNFDLLVDPVDANVLYLTEFDVWRFRSGGWTALAGWNIGQPPFPLNQHLHPDNHVMAWVNAASISSYQLLVGNDGGVYISDPGVSGASWTGLNSNLVVTEFYKGAVDVTGSNVLALGGAQDDFTAVYTGSTAWDMVSGGDGTDCAISATNPVSDWATSFQITTDDPLFNTVEITHTLNGGLPWGVFSMVSSDISDALPFSSEFTVHFEKAPYNDDLFIAGTATLWRCDNFFKIIPSWSPNSPTMVDTNGAPVPISAMAFAPSQKDGLVYAFGTEDGQLRITSNGGGVNWSDLDPAKVLPGRYVSGLAFSPTDRNVLYVTLSGFDESTPGHPGHLFKTTNALASPPTWVNISPPVDLPNNCLAIDPNVSTNIYVGADIGVWNSADGGGSWTHYGPDNGMPNVPVYDLRMNSSSLLTAFTHGRGAYYLGHLNKVFYFHPDDRITRISGCLTCPPDEPWLNPGDLETVGITLQGVLPVDSVDLHATMLASPDISPVSGTQDYGAVTGQGAAVSRVFQFIANTAPGGAKATCGGTVQVVLQLQDQGVDVGQVSIPFRLGVPSHPLVQSFGGVAPPGLPGGWSSAATGTAPPWMITTNQPTNLPDQGEDISAVPPPHSSAMALDLPGSGQTFLISPPFTVVTPQAQLYFLQAFSVPNPSDGAILEIAIGTQGFQDIIRAGGSFIEDGYNTVLSDRNPIGPLPAWSGDSGGWVPVIVNLPPAAAGHPSQLRWRLASSLGATNGAWFVDAVLVTEHLCLPPVSNPVIVNPILSGSSFSFAINTVAGRNYVIEYKTNLTDVAWQTLGTISGNGSQQTINVPSGSGSQAFYRFHLEP